MAARTRLTIVGNLTIDILPSGERVPGGSPWYAGLAAAATGCTVAAITSVGEDYPRRHLQYLEEKGVKTVVNFSSQPSTTYASSWLGGRRILRLINPGPAIPAQMLKNLSSDAVLFSPVAGELQVADVMGVNPVLKCIDLQGFIRTSGEDGIISLTRLRDLQLLKAHVVHASHEEARAATGLRSIWAAAEKMAGMGAEQIIIGLDEGVLAISRKLGNWLVPTRVSCSGDGTGAGDILTGAFIAAILDEGPSLQALASATALLTESLTRPPPYRVVGPPKPPKIQEILGRSIGLD